MRPCITSLPTTDCGVFAFMLLSTIMLAGHFQLSVAFQVKCSWLVNCMKKFKQNLHVGIVLMFKKICF